VNSMPLRRCCEYDNSFNFSRVCLGRVLAKIRKLRGFTQEEVFQRTGFTINYLSLLENGRRGAQIKSLSRLARLYDVPLSFIFSLAEEEKGKHKEEIKYIHKIIVIIWV
jgi:transcriptional regulator with XRE-family HTH domain